MSRVRDLLPGDLVTSGSTSAVFITASPHPGYRGMRLVVWRLADGKWSFDALMADQEVGTVKPTRPVARQARLQSACERGTW